MSRISNRNRSVAAAGRQASPVGTEGKAVDHLVVAAEIEQEWIVEAGVPESHPIQPTRRQQIVVSLTAALPGAESDGLASELAVLQGSQLFAGGDAPELCDAAFVDRGEGDGRPG